MLEPTPTHLVFWKSYSSRSQKSEMSLTEPKSRYQRGWFLLEAPRGTPAFLFQLLEAIDIPWLMAPSHSSAAILMWLCSLTLSLLVSFYSLVILSDPPDNPGSAPNFRVLIYSHVQSLFCHIHRFQELGYGHVGGLFSLPMRTFFIFLIYHDKQLLKTFIMFYLPRDSSVERMGGYSTKCLCTSVKRGELFNFLWGLLCPHRCAPLVSEIRAEGEATRLVSMNRNTPP